MLEGYDERANRVIEIAKALAAREGREVALRDILVGCIAVTEDAGLANLIPEALRQLVTEAQSHKVAQRIKVRPEVTELDRRLREQLSARRSNRITPVDLLLEILAHPSPDVSQFAAQVGLDIRALNEALAAQQVAPFERTTKTTLPAEVMQNLKIFTTNLSGMAERGALSPAYERDRERELIVRILLRKTKRNVALLGPAGVGKTKMVEDLALRIHQGEVPRLQGCTVLALNLVALRAGTSVHGELEARVEYFRRALEEYGDNIILFIDELHTIVGTQVGGHTLDVANALKPLLASGKVRCIGATTRQEYVEHIEADRALSRRFQTVTLAEPSNQAMRKILEQIRPEYEQHHGVQYAPETLDAIIRLCNRFLPMRHYPDKAIDLLDEAGAWLSSQRQSGEDMVVTPDIVRQVLAERLGTSLQEAEEMHYKGLAARLAEQVVGQERALEQVERALLRSLWLKTEQERPRGVFLFVGQRGVGKTFTARLLAEHLCHNERAFLEVDLSQIVRRYREGATDVDWLIGIRPPYVGWERGGILTNHVIEFPNSVVLIRGLEHTSPEVLRLFSTIFGTAECEDGRGQRVSFRDTIFVLVYDFTDREEEAHLGFLQTSMQEASKQEISRMEAERRLVEAGVPDDLLGYVQDVIVFERLDEEALKKIALRTAQQVAEQVKQQEGKSVEFAPELVEDILKTRYDDRVLPVEVERLIEQELAAPLREIKERYPREWDEARLILLQTALSTSGEELVLPRVLVVDDMPDFCEALRQAYPEWKWIYASTPEQASHHIQQQTPHLVLIDTCQRETVPEDKAGISILRQLRAQFPQQVMVLVTAQPQDFETTREAFRAGAYDYLWKQQDLSLLQQMVQLAVENERYRLQQERASKGWCKGTLITYDVFPEGGQIRVVFRPAGETR